MHLKLGQDNSSEERNCKALPGQRPNEMPVMRRDRRPLDGLKDQADGPVAGTGDQEQAKRDLEVESFGRRGSKQLEASLVLVVHQVTCQKSVGRDLSVPDLPQPGPLHAVQGQAQQKSQDHAIHLDRRQAQAGVRIRPRALRRRHLRFELPRAQISTLH